MPEVIITTDGVEVTVTHDADGVTSATIKPLTPGGLSETPTMDLGAVVRGLGLVHGTSNGNGGPPAGAVLKTPSGKGGIHRRGARKAQAKAQPTPATPAPPPPEHLEATTSDVRERAYRRLTPALQEQILRAYQEDPNTTVSGLADTVQVPRWTMNAWVTRLRRPDGPLAHLASKDR